MEIISLHFSTNPDVIKQDENQLLLQILIPSSSFFKLDDSIDNIGDVSNLSEIHLLFFRMQKN